MKTQKRTKISFFKTKMSHSNMYHQITFYLNSFVILQIPNFADKKES